MTCLAFVLICLPLLLQSLCVHRWRNAGVNVRVLTQDASTPEGAAKLLKEAATEGPVGGIFHLAMVRSVEL